jgi:hypothetical protein
LRPSFNLKFTEEPQKNRKNQYSRFNLKITSK